MKLSRPLLTGCAALTAAFALKACNAPTQAPAAADEGYAATGKHCVDEDNCILSLRSTSQPDTTILVLDGFRSAGIAALNTASATPGAFTVLRRYAVDSNNTVYEFTPAEDSQTVCTLLDGYRSGSLTCSPRNVPAPGR